MLIFYCKLTFSKRKSEERFLKSCFYEFVLKTFFNSLCLVWAPPKLVDLPLNYPISGPVIVEAIAFGSQKKLLRIFIVRCSSWNHAWLSIHSLYIFFTETIIVFIWNLIQYFKAIAEKMIEFSFWVKFWFPTNCGKIDQSRPSNDQNGYYFLTQNDSYFLFQNLSVRFISSLPNLGVQSI